MDRCEWHWWFNSRLTAIEQFVDEIQVQAGNNTSGKLSAIQQSVNKILTQVGHKPADKLSTNEQSINDIHGQVIDKLLGPE